MRKSVSVWRVKGKDTAEMRDEEILCELAFLSDIVSHLDVLNLQLQGRRHIITEMCATVRVFKTMFCLWKTLVLGASRFPCFLPATMPQLHTQAAQIRSMFGSTDLCEQFFSMMKLNKTPHRS